MRTSGIILLVALVLAGMTGIGVAAPLLSNSGGGSWQYYREITISNSGGALSDYQVLVSLSISNFPTNAQASGADIRFTDASGAELSYWIESWDYPGRSAKIWVKVPSIPAGAVATIRMYYGNPSASSSSSGDATFLLFDDMNDNSLDTNKWQAVGKPILEQNGEWETGYSSTYEPFGNIISKSTFSGNIGISVKIQTTGDGHTFPNVPVMRSSTSDWGWTGYRLYFSKYDNSIAFARIDASTMTNLFNFNPSLYSINTFYTFKVNFYGSSINGGLYDINGNAIETFNLVDNTYRTGYVSVRGPAYSSSVAKWDDIKVRKFASPEPTLTLSAEQLIDTIPPSISVSTPTNGQSVTTNTITISGVASDNIALSKVEVKVGTGSWQLASGTTSWSKQVTLSSGSNTIYAKATDTAGNTAESSITVVYNPSAVSNPEAAGSYIRINSGTLAGQAISASNTEITVSPGSAISGSFTIDVKNNAPWPNAVFITAATPNWGTHSASYWQVASRLGTFTETQTVNANLNAPSTPGTYYIIVAGQWELSAGNVASATNWAVGSDHWNDGNDVADWSTSTIESARSSGIVTASWELQQGIVQSYIPATAIKVIVVLPTVTTPAPTTPTPTPIITQTTPTPTPPRVPPIVKLRPLNDVVTKSADGKVELFMSNPSLNEETLHVDAYVSAPSGIYVYGQGFGEAGAAGTVYAKFDILPGTAKSVDINIKGEKVGTFNVDFKGIYYAGNDKDAFNTISLQHPFIVTENIPTATPAMPKPTEAPRIPGFESVLAIASLLAFYMLRSFKW